MSVCTCKKGCTPDCLCACHRPFSLGAVFSNPTKNREDKEAELDDHYNESLFNMTDEELDQEYQDKIGE